MKRAFALAVVTFFAVGCGGDAAGAGPAKAPDDAATPAAEPPADAAAADKPAADATPADKPAADKPAGGADEGAWAGEAEAKNTKASEGSGKGPETRTMDVIGQIVKDNRKPVRECFDKAKKDLPDLKGDMVIHFVVDPDGKVKKADLNQERSTIKSPAVVDCSIKIIFGIKFPPSSRGMDTTVNYPFNFN
jgi:hypothetical protein